MIYVKIGKHIEELQFTPSVFLYYPGSPDYVLDDIELDLKVGDAGQLSFRMYKNHPYYDRMAFNREFVYVYRDGLTIDDIIFYGFISEIDRDLNNTLTVYCTGALSILDRMILPPVGSSTTVFYWARDLIRYHNDYIVTNNVVDYNEEYIDGFKIFGVDRDTESSFFTGGYMTTLEAFRKTLSETFGLYPYISLRSFVSGSSGLYLGLAPIEEYGELSNQTIEFGSNLLQYADERSSDGIYTAILPLGKRKDNAEKTTEPYQDYYTIWSVNGQKLTLKNATTAAIYGFRCALVQWDWITNPTTLKNKAQTWLNNVTFDNFRLTLTALDLSSLGNDYSAFKLGDRVRCTAEPLGLDITLPIYEMKIYPLEPDKNTITLGSDEPAITTGGTTSPISGSTSDGPEALDMVIKTYTCSYAVSGGSQAALTAENFGVSTPSGYTPIGIQRIAAGNANMLIRAYNAKATGSSAVINLCNNSSSSVNATATIDIVYVR
jgi:hypothetical protein